MLDIENRLEMLEHVVKQTEEFDEQTKQTGG